MPAQSRAGIKAEQSQLSRLWHVSDVQMYLFSEERLMLAAKLFFQWNSPVQARFFFFKYITASTRCSQDILFKGNSPSKSYLSGLHRSCYYSPCVAVTLQAKCVHLAGDPVREVIHRSPFVVPLLPLLADKICSRKPVCKVEMYPPGPA